MENWGLITGSSAYYQYVIASTFDPVRMCQWLACDVLLLRDEADHSHISDMILSTATSRQRKI